MAETKTSTKNIGLKRFDKFRVKRKEQKTKRRGFSVLIYGETAIGKSVGMIDIARQLWEQQDRDCIIISTEGQKTHNNVDQYCEVYPEFNPIIIELKAKKTLWGRVEHLREIIDSINREIRTTPDIKFTIILDSATDVWEDLLDWMNYSPEIMRQKITTTLPDGSKETSYSPMPTEWRKARKKFMDLLKDLTQNQNIFFMFSARPRLDKEYQPTGALLDSKNFGEHFATVIIEGKFKDKGKGRTWTLMKLDLLAKGKNGQLVGWAASKRKRVSGYLSIDKIVKLGYAAMGINLMKFLEDVDKIPESIMESEQPEDTIEKQESEDSSDSG